MLQIDGRSTPALNDKNVGDAEQQRRLGLIAEAEGELRTITTELTDFTFAVGVASRLLAGTRAKLSRPDLANSKRKGRPTPASRRGWRPL